MRDELLAYYERELTFIRQMGAEFAEKYPKIAGRLQLEADKCEDPHVERLIEAFAFLAGRIHHKLDDELPEITESLLNVLYPHYLAPIPSMSIVQFVLDPDRGKLTSGYPIDRHTTLYSRPVGFEKDEGMLPYPSRSFLGYRLLQEYFTFPDKSLFVEVVGLDRAARAGFGETLEILIFLDRSPRIEQPVDAGSFRLGCTPIINLFPQVAEPIRLTHAQTEYRVIPDLRRQAATEVYSIDDVLSTVPSSQEPTHFRPFYS
ncbi:MAG: type VI secretion system baseplate subunit TssF [Nitrospinae bacterium]|nr:type VI secretion system baseplate subunit TssF [Nitrospinota bacterium]